MSIFEDTARPILKEIPRRPLTEQEMLDINITVQNALMNTGKVMYSYVTFHPCSDRLDGHVFILPQTNADSNDVKIYRTLEFTVPYDKENE